MVLMLDVMVRAGREGEPFARTARSIGTRFKSWIVERLSVSDEAERDRAAVRLLATIDGLVLLTHAGFKTT